MKQRLLMVLAIVLAVRAMPAIAQDSAWQAVAPYVDQQTLYVAHVDLSKIDVPAMRQWVDRIIEQGAAGKPNVSNDDKAMVARRLDEIQQAASSFLERFRAAGGRDVYVVFGNISQGMMHYVFPVGPQADKEALVRLLNGDRPADRGSGMIAEAMDGAVVMGSQAALDALRQQRAAPRPDLEVAMSAAGDAPIRVAAGLSDDARRVIAELMPPLPPELGVRDSTVLARGLRWASISITPPPQVQLHVIIQATDAAAAGQLDNIALAAIKWARSLPQAQKQIPGWAQIIDSLTPTVQADRLVVALGDEQIRQLAGKVIVPQLAGAREKALRIASAANLRQIGLAAHMYAAAHQSTFPDDLNTLAKSNNLASQVLKNPRHPQWDVGYIYLKPNMATAQHTAQEHVLAYERYEQWDGGINVLFVDGHVEWIADEAAFKRDLAETMKRNESKQP